ncbi:hypothetical protein MIM_c26100 [Advenella mimigardefordensis DPN7]|uniref:Uncharacterized protein n=2 Tax=Advenella mimigardefordensis TaxID=302406 RepID=W0PH03_ADVMD|nr:hypothetical protein MIM_c26100 [Advenella mimigardefordensis DPN7]
MLVKWCRAMLLAGFAVMSGMYLPVASSQVISFANPFVGVGSAQQEIALNPCLPETDVRNQFGAGAVQQLQQALNQWPANVCTDPLIARNLADWLYNSSALIAKTDRPLVMADIVQTRTRVLLACRDLKCMRDKLPAMVDWAKTNLDRTPVYGLDDQPSSVEGALLSLPRLSLRGLDLPLPGQQKFCGGGTIDDLNFFSTNLKVSGKAYVLVKCKVDNGERKSWILENDGGKDWRAVVDLRSSSMQIGTLRRNNHPIISSYLEETGGTRVRILSYQDNSYQEMLRFLVVEDRSKLGHAFEIENR